MKMFLMVENGHTGENYDGVWFDGTLEQFDGCFGTGHDEAAVRDFAAEHGSFIVGDIS